MMFTIFSIAFAMGALLALRFKFLILLPAIGLAAICAVGAGIAYGDSIGAVMLTTALVTAGLQIGYVFALFAPTALASLGVHKPPPVGKHGLR